VVMASGRGEWHPSAPTALCGPSDRPVFAYIGILDLRPCSSASARLPTTSHCQCAYRRCRPNGLHFSSLSAENIQVRCCNTCDGTTFNWTSTRWVQQRATYFAVKRRSGAVSGMETRGAASAPSLRSCVKPQMPVAPRPARRPPRWQTLGSRGAALCGPTPNPAITRVRRGKSFLYYSPAPKTSDKPRPALRRISSARLSHLPYENVWICADSLGPPAGHGPRTRAGRQAVSLPSAMARDARTMRSSNAMIEFGESFAFVCVPRLRTDLKTSGTATGTRVLATVVSLPRTPRRQEVGNIEYARKATASFGLDHAAQIAMYVSFAQAGLRLQFAGQERCRS